MKIFQRLINQIKPKFWDSRTQMTHHQILFNYRRFWIFSIFLCTIIILVPLGLLLMINHSLVHKAIKNENQLRTIRLTSNTRRTISFFLAERLDALKFIIQGNKFERLTNSSDLSSIMQSLKMGFGGFVDLGIINSSGVQINYVGPFNLKGKNYFDQKWFTKCLENGSYVSDVFWGYRKAPHMIVAVKSSKQKGSFYILRATLDIKKFVQILSSLELSDKSDVFLCNREGLLQTPSKYYGELFKKMCLPIPPDSPRSQILETKDKEGNPILIGYAYIENSPYILMLVKQTEEVMKGWLFLRKEMNWLFLGSAVIILILIISLSTFMVSKIYDADQTRIKAIEHIESTSRLISLGRLAAGIAHEINNPLAIINENTGLIKDLFTLKKEYNGNQRLIELIDDVLESVERCGDITKQLLGFARHFEPKIQSVRISSVIKEVLTFLKKEASYRNININMNIPEDLPVIYSDHGSLQQIFLNLINNAFQAMNDGGRLDISASMEEEGSVAVSVRDSGCGISPEAQKKIFEPFYTTKSMKGGTGLGLSITYGLVQKLKGNISVQSKIDEGTTFIVTLPIKPDGDIKNESLTG